MKADINVEFTAAISRITCYDVNDFSYNLIVRLNYTLYAKCVSDSCM